MMCAPHGGKVRCLEPGKRADHFCHSGMATRPGGRADHDAPALPVAGRLLLRHARVHCFISPAGTSIDRNYDVRWKAAVL